MAPILLGVHDDLVGFLGVKRQVAVGPPCSQVLNLIPVGRLIASELTSANLIMVLVS